MLKTINCGIQPTKATKYSAGIDLYANRDVVIGAGETAIVGLGVCIDFENFWDIYAHDNLSDKSQTQLKIWKKMFIERHHLELYPRSSLRAKGLIVGVGIIDMDYKDEIKIIIHNPIKPNEILNYIRSAQGYDENSQIDTTFKIKKGDKIAQILLKEHKGYLVGIESDEDRKGGFGSTGK